MVGSRINNPDYNCFTSCLSRLPALVLTNLLVVGSQDYDLTSTEDWDSLNSCCEDAKIAMFIDSDCTSLPPRPPPRVDSPTAAQPPAPVPQAGEAIPKVDDTYCDPDHVSSSSY